MIKINIYIYPILLLVIFYSSFVVSTGIKNFYVDPVCTSNCGSNTYGNIEDALAALIKSSDWWNTPILYLKPGTYKGYKNKEIFIEGLKNLEIRTTGVNNTIIDCEKSTFGFYIKNVKQITFDGVIIKNCRSIYGGAIRSVDSTISLKNMQFESNSAIYGGAIYSTSKLLTISNSKFTNNFAVKSGGAIHTSYSIVKVLGTTSFSCNSLNSGVSSSPGTRNEIYCDKSKISLDDSVSIANLGFICSKTCSISRTTLPSKSLCNNIASNTMCQSSGGNSSNPTDPNAGGQSCSIFEGQNPGKIIVDGVCNALYENCLNNPFDCKSCYFSGISLEYTFGNSTKDYHMYPTFNIKNINSFVTDSTPSPFIGLVKSYISVEKTGYYSFMTIGSNIDVELSINNIIVVNTYFQQSFSNSTDMFYLEKDKIHTIQAQIITAELLKPVSLSLIVKEYFDDPNGKEIEPFFYSKNICGDGIYDADESVSCPSDKAKSSKIIDNTGNEVCTSSDPNLDFTNCYSLLTKTCPSRTVPNGFIAPGFKFTLSDMLGNLVNNQFLWHLPGSEHIAFGVDITTALEASAPLFYFSYCDSKATKLVEDVYRLSTYDLPLELSAKPLPECKFSTQTQFFSDSQTMASKMYDKASQEFSAGAGGGVPIISLEAKVAFKNEKSVEKANSLSISKSETLITTDLYCTTSVVELSDKYSFHPLFLQLVSQAKDVNQMLAVVNKYGTHFYKKAIMGGRLTRVTSASMQSNSKTEQDKWAESTSRTFSSSLNTPVFQASASFTQTQDSSIDSSTHVKMESESKRSTIITYGGPLGAYGPTDDFSNSNFEEWATGVDLLPIPVDYDLFPIREIIPKEWKVSGSPSKSIQELWYEAELMFYNSKLTTNSETITNGFDYSFIFKPLNDYTEFLPILTIEWYAINPFASESTLLTTVIKLPYKWTFYDGTVRTFTSPSGTTYSETNIEYYNQGTQLDFYRNEMRDIPFLENPVDWETCTGWDERKHWCFTYFYENKNVLGIQPGTPHVIHFKGPDIFGLHDQSRGFPKITLENIHPTYVDGPIKIISWKTGEAVLINHAGAIISDHISYTNLHYTRIYSELPIWSVAQHYTHDQKGILYDCLEGASGLDGCYSLYNDPYWHGQLMICCTQLFSLMITSGKFNPNFDEIIYNSGGNVYLDYYFAKNTGNKFFFWGEANGDQNNGDYVDLQSNIYFNSRTRLKWALKFSPASYDPNLPGIDKRDWKRKVLAHRSPAENPFMYYESAYAIPDISVMYERGQFEMASNRWNLFPLKDFTKEQFNFHNYKTDHFSINPEQD